MSWILGNSVSRAATYFASSLEKIGFFPNREEADLIKNIGRQSSTMYIRQAFLAFEIRSEER